MPIRAIETKYKGYRFRSRLEARWAVFFDALGIEWEYEPEGFELENGDRYLPDFWLPKNNCWIEIKGYMGFALSNHDLHLKFASELNQRLIVFIDSPWEAKVLFYDPEGYLPGFLKGLNRIGILIDSNMGDRPKDGSMPKEGALVYDDSVVYWGFGEHDDYRGADAVYNSDLISDEYLTCHRIAANKAKSARFEFGEDGT